MDSCDVLSGLGGTLETGTEGLDDSAVAFHRENEGDIDTDTFRQGILNCWEGAGGGWNLDHDIRAIDLRPQLTGLFECGGRVIRNSRIDLNGYTAICPISGGVNIRKEVTRILNVFNGKGVYRFIGAGL